MNVLNDDKGELDIDDLYRAHLSVDVYIQHHLSQPEYVESLIPKEIVISEHVESHIHENEDIIAKLIEEITREDEHGVEGLNDVGDEMNYVGDGINDDVCEVHNRIDMLNVYASSYDSEDESTIMIVIWKLSLMILMRVDIVLKKKLVT